MTVNTPRTFKRTKTDLAEDALMIVAGLIITVIGVFDYGHGIVFGIGGGLLVFGFCQGRKDLKQYWTERK